MGVNNGIHFEYQLFSLSLSLLGDIPNTHGQFAPPTPRYLPSYAYVQTHKEITSTDFAVTTSNYALCTPTITNCLQKDAHYSRMLQHKNINPVLVVLVLYLTRLNT